MYWRNYKWKFDSPFWKFIWMLSEPSFLWILLNFHYFHPVLSYLWLFQSSIINWSNFKPGTVFNPRDTTNGGRKQSFYVNKNMLLISNDCVCHQYCLIIFQVHNSGALVISAMLDFLTFSLCSPYSETTDSDHFDNLLETVACNGRIVFKLFQVSFNF